MLLVKEKFKIFVLIIIICIIFQVTPSVALSNVTTVKMFFFFFLNVNFAKPTVKLHVYCITSMLVKFQNDQRSIARYSI